MKRKEAYLNTLGIILIVFSFLLCGCARYVTVEKQTEYHEEVAGLEEYLLDNVGDYLRFEQSDIIEDEKYFEWHMTFVSDYTRNEELVSEHSYLEIMENTRVLFNEFLNTNPDYFLNEGYRITCEFYLAPDRSPESTTHNEILGVISNRFNDNRFLGAVDYTNYIIKAPDLGLTFTGVEHVTVPFYADLDTAVEIVDSFPDLKQVVYESDYATELAELRPDIEIRDHR